MSSHAVQRVVIVLLIALPTVVHGFGLDRGTWGDSPGVVLSTLADEPVLDSERLLVEHRALAGIEMTVNHRFDTDGLWQVRYFNRERHTNLNEYIQDYERLQDRLVAAWGEPDVADKEWKNDMLQGHPEQYGRAIAAGQLVYMAGWETDETRIVMVLQGEQFRVAHHLIFTDPDTEFDWD